MINLFKCHEKHKSWNERNTELRQRDMSNFSISSHSFLKNAKQQNNK